MEFSLKQLFLIIMKKLPLILAFSVLLALGAYFYTSYIVTPLYTSQAFLSYQANENRKNYKAINTGDFTVSTELVNSFPELIRDDSCINIVKRTTGLEYTNEQIRRMISISSSGTENFYLKVSCPNKEHSLILVNAFAKVISDVSIVNGTLEGYDSTDPDRGYISQIINAGTVKLISEAKNQPTSPSYPNIGRSTILGFLLGFIIASLFFILKDVVNSKVITETDIERLLLDIPALGSIPLIIPNEKGRVK